MASFGILQSQTSSAINKVVSISLCSTMDLIAVLLSDFTIIIYRTLSWKKVLVNADLLAKSYSLNLTHITANSLDASSSSSDLVPHLLQFAPSGKVLSVGCRGGVTLSLDIETEVSYRCGPLSRSQLSQITCQCSPESTLISLAWCTLNDDEHVLSASGDGATCAAVGPAEQVHTLCLPVLCEDGESVEDNPEGGVRALLLREHAVLLGVTSEGLLLGSFCGIFPLFCVELMPLLSSALSGDFSLSDCMVSVGGNAFAKQTGTDEPTSSMYVEAITPVHRPLLKAQQQLVVPIIDPRRGCQALLFETRMARQLIEVLSDLSQAQALLLACARKWKDATKVIVAKMSLLRSLLEGYDLHMTPVEFMYSVVMCGHWHPAVITHFSTHWNAAGIARLLSAVDIASQSISKDICFRVLPIATNVLLRVQHLLRAHQDQGHGAESTLLAGLRRLQAGADVLLCKSDEAIAATHAARDGMCLYVEFIRHYAVDPDAEVEDGAPDTKAALAPGLLLRSKFMRMFDPRAGRYNHIPTSAAGAPEGAYCAVGCVPQSETVTGTFLFAHLQEQNLPAELLKLRRQSPATVSGSPSTGTGTDTGTVTGLEFLQSALALAGPNSSIGADADADARSLLGQVKRLRVDVETLVILDNSGRYSQALHDGMMTAMTAAPSPTSSSSAVGLRHWDSRVIDRFYHLTHSAPTAAFGVNPNYILAAVARESVAIRPDNKTTVNLNSVRLTSIDADGDLCLLHCSDLTAQAYSCQGVQGETVVGVSVRDTCSDRTYVGSVSLGVEVQEKFIDSIWKKHQETGGIDVAGGAWRAALHDQFVLKAVKLYPRVSMEDADDSSVGQPEPVVTIDLVGLLTYSTAGIDAGAGCGAGGLQPFYNVLFRLGHADLVFTPGCAGAEAGGGVEVEGLSVRHRVLDDAGVAPASSTAASSAMASTVDDPAGRPGAFCGTNAVRLFACDSDRGVATLVYFCNTLLVLDLEEEEEEEEEEADCSVDNMES